MIKEIARLTAIAAAVLAAGSIAAPRAHAAGTDISSPTPRMFEPFKMRIHMTPAAMKVIHADIQKMHKISCTMTDTGFGSDMTVLECTPG